mgnify:CR=1 FL=1
MAKKSTIEKRIAKEKKQFLDILSQNAGIISASCRAANISRFTFYKWYNEDTEFAEKVDDVKEMQKDLCEAQILKKMKDGDTTMLIFYAKTQMKDRGYSERIETTGKNGEPLIPQQEVDISKLTVEEKRALLRVAEQANKTVE